MIPNVIQQEQCRSEHLRTKSVYTERANPTRMNVTTQIGEFETEVDRSAIADVVQDWRIITWEGSMGLNEACRRRRREVCAE